MTVERGTMIINVDDYLKLCNDLEFYKRVVDDIICPYLRLENNVLATVLNDNRKALYEHIMNFKRNVDDKFDDMLNDENIR